MFEKLFSERSAKQEGFLPKNEAQQSAKLIADLRQGPRFKLRKELPTFRSSISASHGVLGNDLSLIAALDLGNREALLLISDGYIGQRAHFDLRRRLSEANYKISQESIATAALIAELNAAINKEGTDKNSSDVQPLIDEVIREAVAQSVTDIHICRREASGMVLFRIHGKLKPHRQFEIDTCDQIAGYLYTKMAEPRSHSGGTYNAEAKSLSCMIRVIVEGNAYKLRYKFLRLSDGWDVITRVLPVETSGKGNKTFAELGYEPSQVEQLELAVARSIGLIAITGPTGSGKSTTLKTMMEFDPKRLLKKRYSIEDPVEYKIFGVSQIAVQRNDHDDEQESKVDFTGVLRSILRADPNDVMIGEIRDEVTTQMMADAVMTGHKIYTSLHTHSAIGAAIRLNRLGLDRAVLADRQFIAALVFQRLLPVLCAHCKQPAKTVLPQKTLALLEHKYKLNTDTIRCLNSTGCDHCHHLGVTNQTVVAEIIIPDKHLRQYIGSGQDDLAETYWRQSRQTAFDDPNMMGKTAFEHALYKVSTGMIDPRDVEHEFEPLETYECVESSA